MTLDGFSTPGSQQLKHAFILNCGIPQPMRKKAHPKAELLEEEDNFF